MPENTSNAGLSALDEILSVEAEDSRAVAGGGEDHQKEVTSCRVVFYRYCVQSKHSSIYFFYFLFPGMGC